MLLPENTILPVEYEESQTAKIEELKTDQPGEVEAINNEHGFILSIGRKNEQYTIDQYQIDNQNLVNIITADTEISKVETAQDGFFYLKVNPSNTLTKQILWSTLDKSVERTITDTTENATEAFYAYGKDDVVYVNNSNQVVFSNSQGNKTVYDLNQNLSVTKICWSEVYNSGFFLARDDQSDTVTLYHLLLDGGELKVNATVKDVITFDLDSTKTRLVYSTQQKDGIDIYVIADIKTINPQKLFTGQNIDRIAVDENKNVYYSKLLEIGERSTLWIYDNEKSQSYQLCSPFRLSSGIFPVKGENEIFFSAKQLSYLENSDIIQANNYITDLRFSL